MQFAMALILIVSGVGLMVMPTQVLRSLRWITATATVERHRNHLATIGLASFASGIALLIYLLS